MSGARMNPEEQVTRMLVLLREKCPKLQPTVAPRFLCDEALMSEVQLGSIASAAKHHTACQACRAKDNEIRGVAKWRLNIMQKTYILSGLEFLCANCVAARDTKALLGQAHSSEAAPLVEHFLRANGLDDTDYRSCQEALSAAYAVMVILSQLPAGAIRVVDADGERFTHSTVVTKATHASSGKKKKKSKKKQNATTIDSSSTKKQSKKKKSKRKKASD